MNLYKLARTVNTIQAITKPRRLPRRLKNIAVGRLLGRMGFWRRLWA
jgi:hypothetical protein